MRALHYYDEIGLPSPTQHSESGYRLYDDKALVGEYDFVSKQLYQMGDLALGAVIRRLEPLTFVRLKIPKFTFCSGAGSEDNV